MPGTQKPLPHGLLCPPSCAPATAIVTIGSMEAFAGGRALPVAVAPRTKLNGMWSLGVSPKGSTDWHSTKLPYTAAFRHVWLLSPSEGTREKEKLNF